jgi:hypothetical protein
MRVPGTRLPRPTKLSLSERNVSHAARHAAPSRSFPSMPATHARPTPNEPRCAPPTGLAQRESYSDQPYSDLKKSRCSAFSASWALAFSQLY